MEAASSLADGTELPDTSNLLQNALNEQPPCAAGILWAILYATEAEFAPVYSEMPSVLGDAAREPFYDLLTLVARLSVTKVRNKKRPSRMINKEVHAALERLRKIFLCGDDVQGEGRRLMEQVVAPPHRRVRRGRFSSDPYERLYIAVCEHFLCSDAFPVDVKLIFAEQDTLRQTVNGAVHGYYVQALRGDADVATMIERIAGWADWDEIKENRSQYDCAVGDSIQVVADIVGYAVGQLAGYDEGILNALTEPTPDASPSTSVVERDWIYDLIVKRERGRIVSTYPKRELVGLMYNFYCLGQTDALMRAFCGESAIDQTEAAVQAAKGSGTLENRFQDILHLYPDWNGYLETGSTVNAVWLNFVERFTRTVCRNSVRTLGGASKLSTEPSAPLRSTLALAGGKTSSS